jgi:hypothetical protein
MKTSIVIFAFLYILSNGFGQNLSSLYKKDVITLDPVPGYAQNNDWNQLFADSAFQGYGRSLGQMKKIVVAPDGSIFMSHKTRYEIWKFDKNGKFVKKFGSKGSKPGQFIMLPSVEGILDGKYIFTTDVQGRMLFFDLDGTFVKSMKLEYMPLDMIPLKGNKIAIIGHVPWKGDVAKKIIRIKDFTTGQEKEIWSDVEPYFQNSIVIRFPRGGMWSCTLPYVHSSLTLFRLAASKNGNLIMASPKTGKIMEYSPDGKLINSFQVNIKPLTITNEDIQHQYQKAVKESDNFEKQFLKGEMGKKLTDSEKTALVNDYKKQLEKIKDRSLYPEHLPYFSSLIVDSDGNLLVFEFTKDDSTTTNRFKAYSYNMKGDFIGSSSFKNETLDLSFNPQAFQFHEGYVYVVANTRKTQAKVTSLRIAKLKPVQ